MRIGFFAATMVVATAVITAFPARADTAAPADVWTGFYLGGNAGYGIAQSGNRISRTDLQQNEFMELGAGGGFGGGQIGYNFRLAPNWIVGVEADLQGGDQRASACSDYCNLPAYGRSSTTDQRVAWFGTARGRLGWASSSSLFYVTGGLAYGRISTRLIEKASTDPFMDVTFSSTNSGWTVGGGIENRVSDHWSLKAEYLYMDLGKARGTFLYTNAPTLLFTPSGQVRNHVVRLGLNYHLNAAPGGSSGFVAFANPTVNWSGFYVGANLGYGVGRNPSSLTSTTNTGALLLTESYDAGPRGGIGGIQAGFNWQAAPRLVLGAEADIQASALAGELCTQTCSPNIRWISTTKQSQPWLGTLRGRMGWLSGSSMIYLTGGLAVGEVRIAASQWIFSLPPGSGEVSATKTGWTLGGGLESHIAGNWFAKAEYLYVDLGRLSGTIDYPANSSSFTTSARFQSHVARIGLNYRLGSAN